jgi:hypothetical protein
MVLPHLPHFQWGLGEVVEQDVLFWLMVFSFGNGDSLLSRCLLPE